MPITWLTLAVDAPLGFDLAYDPVAGALAPTITAPPPAVGRRPACGRTASARTSPHFEALFPQLFPSFVGNLSSSFAAFPLPAFLGLQLDVLEVARQGNYFVLYANLNQVPQTRIENVRVHRPEQRRQRDRLAVRRERVAAPHPPVDLAEPGRASTSRAWSAPTRAAPSTTSGRDAHAGLPAHLRRRPRERRDVAARPEPADPGRAHHLSTRTAAPPNSSISAVTGSRRASVRVRSRTSTSRRA